MSRTAWPAAMVRLIAGVPLHEDLPSPKSGRVYFANHSSNLDFVVIWAALPETLRERVRPVAAADYWQRGPLRRALAKDYFRAVLVARKEIRRDNNPLDLMIATLEQGNDLIIFPEGTRSPDGTLREFRAGIYHLARRFPAVEMLPVHLENLHRMLPKGEILPIPILGRVVFGQCLDPLGEHEAKVDFLRRARDAVLRLGAGNPASDSTPLLNVTS